MGILGIRIRKTPEEKAEEEVIKRQKLMEKVIKERIKYVTKAGNWVAVTACNRHRFFMPPDVRSATNFLANSVFPHIPPDKLLKGYTPPELKGKKLVEFTKDEIQILTKEGFRLRVDGIWDKNGGKYRNGSYTGLRFGDTLPGAIWGKECAGKKEAKEEAKRIKELLGWE
jgi:hypothetical protein